MILSDFVADTTLQAPRPPRMGETLLEKSVALGPGGKGTNLTVAAAISVTRADAAPFIPNRPEIDALLATP